MLDFRRAAIDDFIDIKNITKEFSEFSCELSEINLILWQEIYDFTFCIYDNILFTKNCIHGETSFGLPFCKNMRKAINYLKNYCLENNLPLVIFAGQGERFDLFTKEYGDSFNFNFIRDSFEYLYDQRDLAELSGKKYHSKRNHISSFNRKYNWSFETLSCENKNEVKEMLNQWYNENSEKYNENMKAEHHGLFYILENDLYRNYIGGVLRVDGQVAAVTLGCKINNNIFDVNVEKALQKYEGAYAMINNIFTKTMLAQFSLINREEDMGIEGLRRAKLSYKPKIILEKFLITEVK